jgi:hypothetical protein
VGNHKVALAQSQIHERGDAPDCCGAADHLRLVIVHARGQSGNHMVLAALWQDHWFILDNLTHMLVPEEASEYVPLLVLDDKGVRSYVVQTVNY